MQGILIQEKCIEASKGDASMLVRLTQAKKTEMTDNAREGRR